MINNLNIRSRAIVVEQAVTEWFAEHPSETKVNAKELADYFVKKKIFSNTQNTAQGVHTFLSRVYQNNLIDVMPHVVHEPRGNGSAWFFERLPSDGAPRNAGKLPEYSREVNRYRSSLLAGYKG